MKTETESGGRGGSGRVDGDLDWRRVHDVVADRTAGFDLLADGFERLGVGVGFGGQFDADLLIAGAWLVGHAHELPGVEITLDLDIESGELDVVFVADRLGDDVQTARPRAEQVLDGVGTLVGAAEVGRFVDDELEITDRHRCFRFTVACGRNRELMHVV